MIKEMEKGEKEKMLERNLYIHNSQVHDLLSEFADCFALFIREVLPIPGAEH